MTDDYFGQGGPRSRNQVYICNLPNQTSRWPACEDEVFKIFKVRTCVFDVETILWPCHRNNLDLYNGFEKISGGPSITYFDACFQYLDEVLEALDFDEISWYAQAGQLENNAEKLFSVILRTMRKYKVTGDDNPVDLPDISSMKGRITDWLVILRTLLEINLSDIIEISFEELFRVFLHMVGLSCYRGGYVATLKFHYKDNNGIVVNSVSSQPDLVVCNKRDTVEGFAVAIVDVKKPMRTNQNEPVSPPIDEAEAGSSSGEDHHPCSLLKTDYPNGNSRLMTEEEKKTCSVFLPQLLGEVLAALNSTLMKLHTVPLAPQRVGQFDTIPVKSVIGFGVVGFKVYVVNFLSVRREPILKLPDSMHEIPYIRGMGTDILISEPLNLLKRNDRNRLFRLLFAMKHMNYQR